jgi:hypothetical protein
MRSSAESRSYPMVPLDVFSYEMAVGVRQPERTSVGPPVIAPAPWRPPGLRTPDRCAPAERGTGIERDFQSPAPSRPALLVQITGPRGS